jgi:hypothetical protein
MNRTVTLSNDHGVTVSFVFDRVCNFTCIDSLGNVNTGRRTLKKGEELVRILKVIFGYREKKYGDQTGNPAETH